MDDDFSDVNELSFEAGTNGSDDELDAGNEGHQGSRHNNHDPPAGLHLLHTHPREDRLTLSQDQDFQSQVHVVVRPRLGQAQENVPEPQPRNVDTEESTCSICFESWTNSGSHRLVSIKCGHLFGESCILKWIVQRGRDGAVKCPECNHPTKRKDVRRIWSKSVVVADTAEKDEAVARAKKEQELRMRSEQELAQSRLAYGMLRSEMAKLQAKHDRQRSFKLRYRAELQRLKLTSPEKNIAKHSSYTSFKTVTLPLMPAGTAHYMSYRQDEEMLVCSRQFQDSHGIAKVSMRDLSNNMHSMIPVHSQAIRDVQCYISDPFANKSLVLTASLDKTLKVTSAASQQIVLSYDLGAPVWSCCWSSTNPFAIYCSVKAKQTSILTLDLRNTKSPVASFSLLGHSPIHSMAHIGPSQSQNREAILCGNLEGAFIYNFEASSVSGALSQESITSASQGSTSMDNTRRFDREQDRSIPLRFQGASCSSVSFDATSRHWMASYKFLGKPFTQHVRGYLEQDVSSFDLVLKSEFKVLGGPPVPCMSRTTVFSRQNGSIHMAAGSADGAYVWCGLSRAQSLQNGETSSSQLPMGDSAVERAVLQGAEAAGDRGSAPIKDVKAVNVGYDEFIVTLSDKELRLHRWSEVRLGRIAGDGEGSEDSDEDAIGDDDGGGGSGEKLTVATDKGKRRRVDDDGSEAAHEICNGTVITVEDD